MSMFGGVPIEESTKSTSRFGGVPMEEEKTIPEEIAPSQQAPEAVWEGQKGFIANLESPLTLMKRESLPAKFIQWMSTPEKVYEEKEKLEPKERVRNLPVLRGLENELDALEDIQADRDFTPEEEQRFYKLQDLYGEMFQKASASMEEDAPFDWSALWEGIKAKPGEASAELVNAIVADPELLAVPQAVGLRLAGKMGIAGRSAAAGATGSGIAVVDTAVRNLAESGRINKNDMSLAASIGFVSNAALQAVGDKLVNLARARESLGEPVQVSSVEDILASAQVEANPKELVDIINASTGIERVRSGRPVAVAKKDTYAALRDDPEYTDFLKAEADRAVWHREFDSLQEQKVSQQIKPAKDMTLQEIIDDTVGVKVKTPQQVKSDVAKARRDFKAAVKDDPEMAQFYDKHAEDIYNIRELERNQSFAAREEAAVRKAEEIESDYIADKAILNDRSREDLWLEHDKRELHKQVQEVFQGKKEATKTISEITDIDPEFPTAMENAFEFALKRDAAAVKQLNFETDLNIAMQQMREAGRVGDAANKERYMQMLGRLTKESREMGSIDPKLLSYLAAGSMTATLGYNLSGGDWRVAAGTGVASVAVPWMFSRGFSPLKSLKDWNKTENAINLSSAHFFTRPLTAMMNYGESGRTLAGLVDDLHNNIDLKMAERMDHVEDVFKNIPKENRGQVAQVLRHTLNPKEVSPEVADASKLIRENLDRVLDDAMEAGVYTKDQVKKLKDRVTEKGYFPRVYDEMYLNSSAGRHEWERVWSEQEWSKESLENTLSSILGEKDAKDFIRRTIQFGEGAKAIRLTPAQAKELLNRHGKNLKQARSGHLERSRKLHPKAEEILEPFLMKDDQSTLMQYYHDVYRRIEAAKLFDGVDAEGNTIQDSVAVALMKRIKEDYGDQAAKEVRETYFLTVGDSKESKYLKDQLEYSENIKRGLSWQNNYETATKLSLAALPNMLQALNNGTLRLLNKTGNPITAYTIAMKGIANAASKEGRHFAKLTGAANETTLLEYMGEASVGGKISEGVLRKTGFLTAEKAQRIYAANMGKLYAQNLLKKKMDIDAGRLTGNAASKIIRQMEELRLPTDVPVEQVPESHLHRAGLRFSNELNFRNTPDQLPLAWNSLPGRLFRKFKSFAFHQGRFIKENVIKPATRGNLLPLLHYSSLGAVGGMGVDELRRMIKDDDRDLTNTERYLRGLTMIGGIGLAQDALNSVWREDYGALKFLAGPAMTDLSKVGHKLALSIESGDIIPLRDEYINTLVFPLKEKLKRELKPSPIEEEIKMDLDELNKELDSMSDLEELKKELENL